MAPRRGPRNPTVTNYRQHMSVLDPLMTTREDIRTVQIGLATLFTEPPIDWGAILACAVLVTLSVLLAFRFFQRFMVVTDARAGLR